MFCCLYSNYREVFQNKIQIRFSIETYNKIILYSKPNTFWTALFIWILPLLNMRTQAQRDHTYTCSSTKHKTAKIVSAKLSSRQQRFSLARQVKEIVANCQWSLFYTLLTMIEIKSTKLFMSYGKYGPSLEKNLAHWIFSSVTESVIAGTWSHDYLR